MLKSKNVSSFKEISEFKPDFAKNFYNMNNISLTNWYVYGGGLNYISATIKQSNIIKKYYYIDEVININSNWSISRWENEFTFADFMYETGGRL